MNKWLISLAVILPTLIEVIDTSVVNVSLDHIRGSLSAGLDEATWAITAYLVSNAIIIPITGWLTRIFGRKRYLMFSIILFTVSSLMCGLSGSLASLIFFRVLQGIGGGGLQPISQSILLETFPVEQHGMAMALFGVGVMFGPIIGPILGGWITDTWSWNWIFFINIPIGIISCVLIWMFIQDPPYLKRIRARIDYAGLFLIAAGLGCLQVVLDKGQREDWFSSGFIVWMSLIAACALIAFIIVELRSPEPVVNLRAFKNRSFSSGNIIMFISFFVLFGSIVLIPLYLQQLMGYNAFLAGLALAPGGIATLIAMPVAGKLVSKINPKWILITGIFVSAYSSFMMAQFNIYTDFDMVVRSRFIMGIGMGLVFIPLTNLTLSTIRKEEMGNATGIFNLLRNLGGSFGVAFVTTLLVRRGQFHQSRLGEHLHSLDPHYQAGLGYLSGRTGMHTESATGFIYQNLIRQSSMFAFSDAFYISGVIMICIIPLVFLMRRGVNNSGVSVH